MVSKKKENQDNTMTTKRIVSVKNVTLQILELYQTTPKGPKVHYVGPNKILTLPEDEVSQQIKNLAERRMLKIN